MRILGIDPGYGRCGVAVIEKQNGKEVLLFSDCIETSKETEFSERLNEISVALKKIIAEYTPDKVALEKLFFYSNQKTAIDVAQARGVMIAAASEKNIPIVDVTPAQVKLAVTGYGKSDKRQVIAMVKRLINIEKDIKYDDEYDAIAVALTVLAESQTAYPHNAQ